LVYAIAAARRLCLWQVDFVSAFLNSENTFDVYMEQPRGFEEGEDGYIWKLKKMLYGTMQEVHNWAENLDKTFERHSYYKSCADPQIHPGVINEELTLTSTWTDNILGASSTIEKAKAELSSSYKIKDLGEVTLILGMQITQNDNGDVILSQKAYAQCMLNRFNMSHCIPLSTPLPLGILLSMDDCPATLQEIDEMKSTPYYEALGSLMWLQVATCSDLSYIVNVLSHFSHNSGKSH